ncbi:T9SS type A sorting domain-containing protein [Aureispira anguillae]|uniref:T9SS type A sorting domain-containing protein n=1 Tax=Aureispira anguillae TaxID=2864201 RepID=UPI0038994129
MFSTNCLPTRPHTPFASPKVELYPNPVTSNAIIQHRLERSASVVITIYNFIGETLKIISIDAQQAGFYKKEINCSNIPNGVYLYSLKLEPEGKSTSLTKRFFILH